MLLLSFTGLTKVLVTSGFNEISDKIEVIDLSDPSNVCQPAVLDDYPIDRVASASGGVLNSNIALICGGFRYSSPGERLDDCFAINDNAVKTNITLTQSRSDAASVVMNGNTLWLTGGVILDGTATKSTEFVQLTGTSPGPDLPLRVYGHCLVSLNDTTVLLIGGLLVNLTRSKATFFYDINHQTWTEGPSLIAERSVHSCALFKSPQHSHTDTVIVTGGSNGQSGLASTEILNLNSNSWTSGIPLHS
jgi:hypothetical protein